ncbi:hypothetical protein HA402_005572 [Bradysia odoriphaga]|nr:hypothetical protein HA402_005572 [Bradysia odoriphaga]
MDGIEKRLDGDSQSVLFDPEDVVKKIEKEVQTEMELREHEREWLLFNRHMESSVDNLERRWKNVCGMSAERKRRIMNTWSLLLELHAMTNDQEAWLIAQENDLNDLEQGLDLDLDSLGGNKSVSDCCRYNIWYIRSRNASTMEQYILCSLGSIAGAIIQGCDFIRFTSGRSCWYFWYLLQNE